MLNVFFPEYIPKESKASVMKISCKTPGEFGIELKASSFDRKFIMASTDNLIKSRRKMNFSSVTTRGGKFAYVFNFSFPRKCSQCKIQHHSTTPYYVRI